VLQAILQELLALGRKAAELRIVLQSALLLLGRKIAIALQPLAGVVALLGHTVDGRLLLGARLGAGLGRPRRR